VPDAGRWRPGNLRAVRRRLDVELVRRGLIASRERAQTEIGAGRVLVSGAPAVKASRMVAADEPVTLAPVPARFVSRGGDKLDAALDAFGIVVTGLAALDVGASTGGFTDCLLQRGASNVTALDVGHGQLDARLRADPRVRVVERTNVRFVSAASLGGTFDVVVADLAFISLRTVAGVLVSLTAAGGNLVLLVKPQFEVGRADATRGRGVIRDPDLWGASLAGVREALETEGARVIAAMPSPLKGSSGNVEFLVHAAPVRGG